MGVTKETRLQSARNRISRRVTHMFGDDSSENSEIKLKDFKKLIPCKDQFFAERVFRILDKDGSNGISQSEMRNGLEQMCSQSVEDRVRFLFQIYDRNGDGLIQVHDIKAVLRACSKENAMIFSEEQLDQLAGALYEDAVDSVDSANQEASCHNGLKYEHLKAQLDKHPGLVEGLSLSLVRCLSKTEAPLRKETRPEATISLSSIRNNAAFLTFLVAYISVNVGLLISRGIQFKDTNPFYIGARIFGQALNFNCAIVIVLMLRRLITWLRQTRVALILPLDHHVYFHKLCGTVIAVFASIHTVMHLINFPLNIADKLVSPVTNETHSAAEWLFTMEPGMFGLIPGIANLTGWGLLIILLVMIPCSLPFVRRSGYFEIFYWTHLLYFLFFGLLFLHGRNCWYWLIGPTAAFIFLEKFARFRSRRTGKGKTFVNYAVLLPSRVTHLVCQKPENFNFHPGDYVYINIPEIASSEWHPFTISSAPEHPDDLWLHIRSAGGWTNKLYDFFKNEQIKHGTSSGETQPHLQTTTSQHISIEMSSVLLSSSKTNLDQNRQIKNSASRESLKMRLSRTQSGYRYMRRPPDVISCIIPTEQPGNSDQASLRRKSTRKRTQITFAPDTMPMSNSNPIEEEIQSQEMQIINQVTINEERNPKPSSEGIQIYKPLEVTIDGPYGTPSSRIFRSEHAVLIAAGIGVTPFASILQSIMYRYYANRQTCPNCQHEWAPDMPDSIMNLKKVDFFWINRDQRSFEWFVQLLSQLEIEQAEMGGLMDQFLDLHMYITSALQKNDMKAIALQMALDLLHAKEKRDLLTGLKTRTNSGRPNWDKVFQKLVDEDKGEVTVFYCGPPQLAKTLKKKCVQFGFRFRMEVF